MKAYKPDTTFVFKGKASSSSVNFDLKSTTYKPNSNFDFNTKWDGPSTNFDFGVNDSEVTTLYPIGFSQTRQGNPLVYGSSSHINVTGIFSSTPPSPTIFNAAQQIEVIGFSLTSYGNLSTKNKNSIISPASSVPQTLYGYALIYNLTQYKAIKGFDASLYGKPYVQGGVKYLVTRGVDTSAHGKTVVINTTANREIKPNGINSQAIGALNVTPRILYPEGIYNNGVYIKGRYETIKFGQPDVRDPSIRPPGLAHDSHGTQTIWYHTRPLIPSGILSYESGYPVVYDPTQEIQAISLVTSAIFGDTAIRNERKVLYPTSIFDGVVEQWVIVTNTNRYYSPAGIDSQIYGNTDIRNKTPSIFVGGISQTELGDTAIGHAIRSVAPSGFDRLLLGKPVLTKSPELAPKSFNTSIVSNLFISHRIRTIKPAGFIATLFGDNTAWYRYRYATPLSWLSSKFGTAILTHGVREVIAQGFIREVHGRPWISQGTRFVEPIGINKFYPTFHMVGGSREVKPVGFIATEFGTRIIPEDIYAYPQGLTGVFGLASIRLNTQQLKPLGFISVGQQPADRWGYDAIYNLTQYIEQVQNFDRDNGLIPPAWSEWTIIENRDKQLNTTGLNSLKIGYNKIDNNAAPLLPVGIAPPIGTRYDVSMIAHGVRYISIDGIEAPIVSSWLVFYNDARVIEPTGFVGTQTGLASAESTRRYYSGVGRFESLETGTPMISYAIRQIILEPRYAIMPPQINLPIIDTLTKYAELRGFETDSYGTASLTITFNIIAPKWVHRDKVGDPYIRNLTPEVKLYGHNSELFGMAGVRTQWRNLLAVGDTLTLFGLAKIADTRQVIDIRGWRSTVVAQKHTVIRTGAPPYSQQIISLDGWPDYAGGGYREGDGIDSEKTVSINGKIRVPKPFINQNVLYAEGYVASLWGDNRVWSNNIMIDAGIAIRNISANHAVRHKNRVITLTDEHVIKSKVEFGAPRLSPWTIYAVVESPTQARLNHIDPYLGLHTIDGLRPGGSGANFGSHKVSSTIRNVYQLSSGSKKDGFGVAALQLTRRIISPAAFRRSAVGMPSIPFTLQLITMFNTSTPMSLYGRSTISRVNNGPIMVGVSGFDRLAFGAATDINYRNRLIKPSGYSALLMGSKKNDDKPYMWQGLRVGPHIPLIAGGIDTLRFGVGMASLRVRDITLVGFDAFVSEYDTSAFDQRMTVGLVKKPVPFETRRITVDGFNANKTGVTDVSFGQYFIRPDGNSNQFRKGGYHA